MGKVKWVTVILFIFLFFTVFSVFHVLTAEYNDTYRQYECLHII